MKWAAREEELQALLYWITERHRIYLWRQAGRPWPWTRDPILQSYRFCNVYRELDTVTIWIREHIREPFAEHPYLWLMLAAARHINWPDTLAELIADRKGAWPTKRTWTPERMEAVLTARRARHEKVYTGAYMIRGEAGTKAHYVAARVLGGIWAARQTVTPHLHGTLARAHAALVPHYGWGGFMAYEVVSDLRWCPGWLLDAGDATTWAYAGPGALRGLSRLATGLPRAARPSVSVALEQMQGLRSWLNFRLPPAFPRLQMREVEHSLCEYDKYQRVAHGEGRPRARYTPPEEAS